MERFTRNLELQLQAGVPLVRALRSQVTVDGDRFSDCIESLIGSIEGGGSFAESLELFPETFGSVYRNMIRAGEASGTLDQVLGEIAAYLVWLRQIRKTIAKALRYPAIVLVAVTALILFIIGWLVPKFTPLFDRMGDDLPVATRVLIFLGDWISTGWPLLIVGALVLALGIVVARRTTLGRAWIGGLIQRLPIVGSVVYSIDMARLTRNLGILGRAGIPLVHALALAGDAVLSPRFSDELDDVHDSLLSGESVQQSVARSSHFSPMVVNMIGVGEEAGRLPDVFAWLAAYFDDEAKERVERMFAFLEPMITLLLGGVVGGIAATILLTLYKAMMASAK